MVLVRPFAVRMTLNNETNKEEGMTIVSCMLLNMAHTQGHKYAAEHGPYTRSQVCCWTAHTQGHKYAAEHGPYTRSH